MNVEWDIPFTLTSPYGILDLNVIDGTAGAAFVLDPTKCLAFAGVRSTIDPMPQAHGSIVHREYSDGYSMRLGGAIMLEKDVPACGADLRAAWDALQLHLHALLGGDAASGIVLSGDNNRLQWTPTDYGQDRILGDVRLLEELTPTFDPAGGWVDFSFALHSPFPYAVDQHEDSPSLDVTIDNPGNCVVYPNFKVYGPTTDFVISNVTTGQEIRYDSSQPGGVAIGGGDHAFIGCFANNIYLNGASTNLMAGIDIENSEFFGLIPGTNVLEISGATADVIWNAGWV